MFKLQFETGNSAFDDEGLTVETAKILRDIAVSVERGTRGAPIHDTNGNRIGSWKLTRAGGRL